MKLALSPELDKAVSEQAARLGTDPAILALTALRERFLPNTTIDEPQDVWEQKLLDLVHNCGVSLPDAVLRRENMYEQ